MSILRSSCFYVLKSGPKAGRIQPLSSVDSPVIAWPPASDVYYGRQRRGHGGEGVGEWASQEMYYNEHQARRIAAVAFEQARRRGQRLTFTRAEGIIPALAGNWT